MPAYRKAPSDILERINATIDAFHPELATHEVTVAAQLCSPTEKESLKAEKEGRAPQPLKLNGWPCHATVRKTNAQQRLGGMADALITLDALHWGTLDEAERIALLDHELTHLTVAKGKEGFPKSDDAGRPVLSMRLHDWQLGGGFREVAHRHQQAAPEVVAFREVVVGYGDQLMLEFETSREDALGELVGQAQALGMGY